MLMFSSLSTSIESLPLSPLIVTFEPTLRTESLPAPLSSRALGALLSMRSLPSPVRMVDCSPTFLTLSTAPAPRSNIEAPRLSTATFLVLMVALGETLTMRSRPVEPTIFCLAASEVKSTRSSVPSAMRLMVLPAPPFIMTESFSSGEATLPIMTSLPSTVSLSSAKSSNA